MPRPREFKPEEAFDSIQKTFWVNGYHGTSMQTLEQATGLKKQSLYREFGNKDAMYARALKLYGDREISCLADVIVQAQTAVGRFEDLFEAVLKPVRAGDRSGCFLCNSAIEHAYDSEATQQTAQEGIAATRALFDKALTISERYANDEGLRLQRAQVLAAGYFGLRVMVRGGTPLEELEQTAAALVDLI